MVNKIKEKYNVLKVNTKNDIYFDNKYYSRTASKLQNKIKQAFGL